MSSVFAVAGLSRNGDMAGARRSLVVFWCTLPIVDEHDVAECLLELIRSTTDPYTSFLTVYFGKLTWLEG